MRAPASAAPPQPPRALAGAAPLELRPHPSWWLAAFVVATHLAAAAVALAIAIGPWPRATLLLLIAAGLFYQLWARVLLRAPWSIRAARWDADGFELSRADGTRVAARLHGSSYVGIRLVILNFRVGRFGRPTLILTADALDPETLRRLRARLRLAGRAAVAAAP